MRYREFIDTVLGEELGLRKGRRFRTALKRPGLPHHKTLDIGQQPGPDTGVHPVPGSGDNDLQTRG
ncbi:hypothetical protein AD006_28880 (plasmid) [Pseudonocardia sp. EC080610-09]|uniref:hypothetical protein n=1 Tax=unclassified Pseudonocardia TaxID=2619320 RepID=UPI000705D55E|nr:MULTISPECIES: hypothetical protein [unclassified Pseudonocardia]ALL79321.1 hypothetical protein AD006_28880 [Pseudonocardia sp. EC080610-09]ALL85292.1 hypothetical protein AD017_29270 [Pseudonocardia sp. EC080619-01]